VACHWLIVAVSSRLQPLLQKHDDAQRRMEGGEPCARGRGRSVVPAAEAASSDTGSTSKTFVVPVVGPSRKPAWLSLRPACPARSISSHVHLLSLGLSFGHERDQPPARRRQFIVHRQSCCKIHHASTPNNVCSHESQCARWTHDKA
jgi:hypothetical protein